MLPQLLRRVSHLMFKTCSRLMGRNVPLLFLLPPGFLLRQIPPYYMILLQADIQFSTRQSKNSYKITRATQTSVQLYQPLGTWVHAPTARLPKAPIVFLH